MGKGSESESESVETCFAEYYVAIGFGIQIRVQIWIRVRQWVIRMFPRPYSKDDILLLNHLKGFISITYQSDILKKIDWMKSILDVTLTLVLTLKAGRMSWEPGRGCWRAPTQFYHGSESSGRLSQSPDTSYLQAENTQTVRKSNRLSRNCRAFAFIKSSKTYRKLYNIKNVCLSLGLFVWATVTNMLTNNLNSLKYSDTLARERPINL